MIRTLIVLGHPLWSCHQLHAGPAEAAVDCCLERSFSSGLCRRIRPFIEGLGVAKSHLFLTVNCTSLCLVFGVKWLLLFPAKVARLEESGAKRSLNWGCVQMWLEMWLEMPLVGHNCHCTALFCFCPLIVPLYDCMTPGCNNKMGVLERAFFFFLGIHGKSNTSLHLS